MNRIGRRQLLLVQKPLRRKALQLLIVAVGAIVAMQTIARSSAAQDRFAAAEDLLLRGRYLEAEEQFAALVDVDAVEASIGLSRCYVATGEREQAKKVLNDAAKELPEEARLYAELAELQFHCGNYIAAGDQVATALAIDANCLRARWIAAELLRTAGDINAASKAYEWFVDYYNTSQKTITSAEELRLVGAAAAQFARWNRLHDQFGFLINTLYPDVLAMDGNYWPAHWDRARLFTEKFNTAEAERALTAALRINPNAAELHTARAAMAIQVFDFETATPALGRALDINSECAEAFRLVADIHLANFRTADALSALEKARELNPRSEATLGRLAAVYLIAQGLDAEVAKASFLETVESVKAQNARPGEFYFVMAETLADFRRWPQAKQYYREATSAMPQLVGPRAALGMMLMRLGQEDEALTQLTLAFEEDPFNVRVKNMLEVLDVLETYAELETEHFHFKFDADRDAILANYLAEFMESVYPELCSDFHFHPEERSLFEVFNQAKNTGGHGWFSARMVGLPYVGTVGACAGQMVAMTSPDAMNSKFNWARVARHEFVHVLNLQQTNFNVPHWFTEGLAVEAEGYPRPALWDQLIASRVPTGDLFTLEDINFGFIRPSSQMEWHLAYCQAELYVLFMRAEFSKDGPAAMLDAYADNLTTPAAIERCFGISQAEFEERYAKYLQEIAAALPKGLSVPGEERSFAEIDRTARANPNDPDALAALAEAYLLRKEYPNARKFADAVIKLAEHHPLASYVLARLELVTGEREQALSILQAANNPQQPHPPSIQLLSVLHCVNADFAEAEELVLAAQRAQPELPQWTEDLAAIYLRSGDDAKLASQLEKLAQADADQLPYRKKLALIAQAAGDHADAARWAQEAIWIDVNDIDMHEVFAESALELSDFTRAATEYRTLTQLQPEVIDWRLRLVQVLLQDDQEDVAKEVLQQALQDFPGNQRAKGMLDQIGN